MNEFRRKHKLNKVAQTKAWLDEVELDEKQGFTDFAMKMGLFEYAVERGRIDLFSIVTKMDRIHWFEKAYIKIQGDHQ